MTRNDFIELDIGLSTGKLPEHWQVVLRCAARQVINGKSPRAAFCDVLPEALEVKQSRNEAIREADDGKGSLRARALRLGRRFGLSWRQCARVLAS